VINTVPLENRQKLLEAAPPLSPHTTITQSITVKNQNSSGISFLVDIVKIAPDTLGRFNVEVKKVVDTWSPCIQFDSPKLQHKKTYKYGSEFDYLIKLKNCSNINEKLSLDSRSSIKGLIPLFIINKFDLAPNKSKNL